jgi:hypothetical protein
VARSRRKRCPETETQTEAAQAMTVADSLQVMGVDLMQHNLVSPTHLSAGF